MCFDTLFQTSTTKPQYLQGPPNMFKAEWEQILRQFPLCMGAPSGVLDEAQRALVVGLIPGEAAAPRRASRRAPPRDGMDVDGGVSDDEQSDDEAHDGGVDGMLHTAAKLKGAFGACRTLGTGI